MLKIRLRRMGAIRQPHYRIVVADSRAPRDGAFIETLGHYNPLTNPATIQIDVDKYEDWKRKGAQPTDAVVSLVRRFNKAKRTAEGDTAAPAAAAPAGSRQTRSASGRRSTPAAAAVAADAPQGEAVAEATRDEGEGNEALTGAAVAPTGVDNTEGELVAEAAETASPPAEAVEENISES